MSIDGKLGGFYSDSSCVGGIGGWGVHPLQIERFGSVKDPGTPLLPYTVIDSSSEPELLPFTVQQGDGSFYGAQGALY